MSKETDKTTELLDAHDTLLRFARLFEPVHQAIGKRGAAQVDEYMELWHVYNDDVRPILEQRNKEDYYEPQE